MCVRVCLGPWDDACMHGLLLCANEHQHHSRAAGLDLWFPPPYHVLDLQT